MYNQGLNSDRPSYLTFSSLKSVLKVVTKVIKWWSYPGIWLSYSWTWSLPLVLYNTWIGFRHLHVSLQNFWANSTIYLVKLLGRLNDVILEKGWKHSKPSSISILVWLLSTFTSQTGPIFFLVHCERDIGLNCDSPFTSYKSVDKLINFLVTWISPTNMEHAVCQTLCHMLQTHG